MTHATFTFNTTRSVRFGSGVLAEIGGAALALGGPRALLVTDRGMVATGIVARALAYLAAAGVEVVLYDAVAADPPEPVVLAAAAAAREGAVGGVIGLGGGSSLDVAKLAALIAGGGEELGAVYGVGKARGPRLPLILVPTTAGTGSEVTPISIVTTGAAEKMGVVSPVLLPDLALLDPELTLGLPPQVTAATGIDAMVHAIEAYASASANNNPLSRTLARQALELMGGAILTAVQEGATSRRGARCCSARCWPGRRSPTRRWRRCMRWPTRSAGTSTCRTGSRTPWCCHMCCASTRWSRRSPMPSWRRWSSPTSRRSKARPAPPPSPTGWPISRRAAGYRSG